MNQLLPDDFGLMVAIWGSAACYLAAGFGIIMLCWSKIDASLDAMEQSWLVLVDRRAANEAETEMANDQAPVEIPADPACSPAPWTMKEAANG
jgi:hypothetical protein